MLTSYLRVDVRCIHRNVHTRCTYTTHITYILHYITYIHICNQHIIKYNPIYIQSCTSLLFISLAPCREEISRAMVSCVSPRASKALRQASLMPMFCACSCCSSLSRKVSFALCAMTSSRRVKNHEKKREAMMKNAEKW